MRQLFSSSRNMMTIMIVFTIFAFLIGAVLLRTTTRAQAVELVIGSSSSSSISASSINASMSSVPSAIACTTTDLMAHWKLDEGTGSIAVNATGSGYTGTHENGPVYETGTTMLTSNPWSVFYDGIDDQTRIAGTDFAFGMSGFTVTAFIKPEIGGRSVLGNFGPVNGGYRGWGLYVTGDDHLNFFGYGNAGTNNVYHAATVIDDNWHHVAGTFSRSGSNLTIAVYVNGTFVGSHTAQVGDISSPHDLLFGAYQLQPHYNGALDDVRIYERALSLPGIEAIANGCETSSSSSLTSTSSISSIMSGSSVSMMSSLMSSFSSEPPAGPIPQCHGMDATIYVQGGIIMGGPDDGDLYEGTLKGSWGDDVMVGTENADEIDGKMGDDTLCGLGGADEMDGGFGNDWMDGGTGNDEMKGGMGEDMLFGGGGEDTLQGNIGADQLFGGTENDHLSGDIGKDIACGGAGNDILDGGLNDDRLDGGSGTDSLDGGSFGADQCVAGESLQSCEVTGGSIPECPAE